MSHRSCSCSPPKYNFFEIVLTASNWLISRVSTIRSKDGCRWVWWQPPLRMVQPFACLQFQSREPRFWGKWIATYRMWFKSNKFQHSQDLDHEFALLISGPIWSNRFWWRVFGSSMAAFAERLDASGRTLVKQTRTTWTGLLGAVLERRGILNASST